MKVDLFKTLISVAKHNSITKASEEVFLTQPAVTKRIRTLEQEYGIKIFVKEKNRLFLTEEGKVLLDYANRILALYNESLTVLNGQKNHIKGPLRFGANLTLGVYVIPRFMKLFGDIYPDINFEMFMDNTEHVIDAIERGNINFGFIGVVPDDLRLEIHPFYKDRLKVVIGPRYVLKKRVISWKELENIPFIGREKGSDIRETYEEWFREKSIRITPKMELNNTEAIKLSVQCGLGFSILPWCTIEHEVRRELLRVLSVPHFDPLQQFFICHVKKKKFSNAERMFLEYVLKFVEKGDLTLPSI